MPSSGRVGSKKPKCIRTVEKKSPRGLPEPLRRKSEAVFSSSVEKREKMTASVLYEVAKSTKCR